MVTGYEGTAITTSKVTGSVPAGTGLLLKGDADTYSIPVVASSSTNVTSNKLKAGTGASVAAESGYTRYVLGVSNNGTPEDTSDDHAVFKKIDTNAATVAKGKAYLEFDVLVPVKALNFVVDDTVTGIEVAPAVEEAEEDGVLYNVNGQVVSKDYKGIVIKNGKKFYNK